MFAHKSFYLQLRSKIFYVGYKDHSGKLRWNTTQCTDRTLATQFAEEFVAKKAAEPIPPPEPPKEIRIPKLSEFWSTFKTLKTNSISPKTLKTYEEAYELFKSLSGNLPLDKYTLSHIENFKNELIARKNRPITVNNRFRHIKGIFGFAVKQEVIQKNICAKSSFLRVAKRAPVYMTKEQITYFLDNVKEVILKDIFTLAAYSGMRLSECTHLRWNNVDFAKNQLLVANTEDFVTKSGNERIIPLHPIVAEVLKRRFESKKTSPYVFAKNFGGYLFAAGYISQRFRNYITALHMPKEFHFHSLRHSFATMLVSNGTSIYAVRDLMGHSSVNTTEIYANNSPSSLQSAIRNI